MPFKKDEPKIKDLPNTGHPSRFFPDNNVKNGSPKTEPISPEARNAEQKDTQTLNPSEIFSPEIPKDIKDDVEIVDISNDKAQRFNFYIHCSKCDWEGRTFYKENAISMREQHIFNHTILKSQG